MELTSKIQTPEQITKLVDEAVKVRVAIIGDAAAVVADFKSDDKDNATIQREVVTTITAGDTTVKAIADAVLSGSTLEGADSAKLSTVFAAVVAAAKSKGTVTEPDLTLAKVIAGDTNHNASTNTKLVGRELFLARQAAGFKRNKKGELLTA